MVRCVVDVKYAGGHTSEKAKRRETARAAMLAWCLRQLGWWVGIRGAFPDVFGDYRWGFYWDLTRNDVRRPDVCIDATSRPTMRRGAADAAVSVAFRTTVNVARDREFLKHYDLLVAHEHAPELGREPGLMPVPFPVGEPVLETLEMHGLLYSYLTDDLDQIRHHVCRNLRAGIGFIGCGHYGRREAVAAFPGVLSEVAFCDDRKDRTAGVTYMRKMGGWEAGLHLAGDTPWANRFSELVLLGTAVIMLPNPVRIEPAVDQDNVILMRDWSDVAALEAGLENRPWIVEQADRCYCVGWSPMAQARSLKSRVEAML